MKPIPIRQRIPTSFLLKQQLATLLSNECRPLGFHILLRFTSNFQKQTCTVKFEGHNRLSIFLNLASLKGGFSSPRCSWRFRVAYTALFVAAYIDQLEQARNRIPQTYWEGLAFLDAILDATGNHPVKLYSPLSLWNAKPNRTFTIRPIEVRNAIQSLTKLRESPPPGLTETDAVAIRTALDALSSYAQVPEIAYLRGSVPVYVLMHSFRDLADRIQADSGVVAKFPLLTLAPFEQTERLTVSSMLKSCTQRENDFLSGVAIRFAALFSQPTPPALDSASRENLVAAMNVYKERSIAYVSQIPQAARCLLTDNLLAVKKTVQAMNEYTALCGAPVTTGSVHSIV